MDYSAVTLEIIIALSGVILLVLGLLIPEERRTIGYLSIGAFALALGYSFYLKTGSTFLNGIYKNDSFALFFKQLFLVSAILVSFLSLSYSKRLPENKSEFFVLPFFAVLGMMIMASANDFLTLYIGLELMTITFIILTAFETFNLKSNESGMKYVLLSAMSSAILLFGISLLYGLSGSTFFSDIIRGIQTGVNSPLIILAVIMVIAGFGFKISAVPFHMWSPDIYEGAPTPVTTFLAVGSKMASFAALLRVLYVVFPGEYRIFMTIVIAIAALTMIIGNLIAIPQENIKRLLAFSSIAHAGYILLGVIAYSRTGLGASLFYLPAYIFANTAIFAAIIAVSKSSEGDKIREFSGMWKSSPFISVIVLISLLSLAGIPPAAGFIGKFYLFVAVVKQGYLWIAFLAFAMSLVSVYYYMVVVRTMLIGESENNTKMEVPLSLKTVMVVCTIATLILGIYPTPIIDWTTSVAASLF